jgi:hypothetical protein
MDNLIPALPHDLGKIVASLWGVGRVKLALDEFNPVSMIEVPLHDVYIIIVHSIGI